jgi:hypothetical protein
MESVGKALLDKGYLLSALELWMESLETNEPIACLGEFFRDFRPEKASVLQKVIDSCDKDEIERLFHQVAPATDDELQNLGSQQLLLRLKEAEEKLSLIKYQFELSKEAALLASKNERAISVGSSIQSAAPELIGERDKVLNELEGSGDVHEQRILQFLLRQHLLSQNYKMTAVTLAEEVQGVLPTKWSEVGLDLQEPPRLGTMLRYYYSAGAQRVGLEIAKQPTLVARLEEKTGQVEGLEGQLSDLKRELALAERKAETLEAEKKRMLSAWEHDVEEARRVARREAMESMPSVVAVAPQKQATEKEEEKEETVSYVAPSPGVLQPMDDFDFLFARRLFARQLVSSDESQESNARVREQIRGLANVRLNDWDGLVKVYASSLPHIIPGIILRAREEIVPVLLGTIQQVEDERTRGSLTSLLFCLVKKPDVSQRNTILHACKVLAELIGRERTERELVPQCWDGMNDKAEERRLLAADFCGVLMPYVRDGRRVPLTLNVLRTLLEDPSPAVRAAAAKNMGFVCLFVCCCFFLLMCCCL